MKLVFLGLDTRVRPRQMAMAGRAVAGRRARPAGSACSSTAGGFPTGDRHRFLLEADLGVSAHFDNAETRFAFRTRLLDYFWCSLPIVCSGGDVLGELIRSRGGGRVVAERDVEGWVGAVCRLLDDEGERGRARAALELIREEFYWDRACKPLLRIARQERATTHVRGAQGLIARSALAGVRSSIARRGVSENCPSGDEAPPRPRWRQTLLDLPRGRSRRHLCHRASRDGALQRGLWSSPCARRGRPSSISAADTGPTR